MNLRHCIAWSFGVAWFGAGAPLCAHELQGYVSVVSDYVFRGASQSNRDPTVQAGIDYRHGSGVYGGIFAAHTDFPENEYGLDPGPVELDAYLGYGQDVGQDWSWDLAAVHYDYLDSTGFDYSYAELAANLRYRDRLRLGATVSDDAASSGARGWTAEIELRHLLGNRLHASGSLGRYEFARSGWPDYFYWDVGLSAVVDRLTFDLRYFDTDTQQAGFAGPRLTGSRLVGSVSLGF